MRPPEPVGATPGYPGGVGVVAEQHEAHWVLVSALLPTRSKGLNPSLDSAPCMVETRGQPAGISIFRPIETLGTVFPPSPFPGAEFETLTNQLRTSCWNWIQDPQAYRNTLNIWSCSFSPQPLGRWVF